MKNIKKYCLHGKIFNEVLVALSNIFMCFFIIIGIKINLKVGSKPIYSKRCLQLWKSDVKKKKKAERCVLWKIHMQRTFAETLETRTHDKRFLLSSIIWGTRSTSDRERLNERRVELRSALMRRANSAVPVHSWLNRQTLTDFTHFALAQRCRRPPSTLHTFVVNSILLLSRGEFLY